MKRLIRGLWNLAELAIMLGILGPVLYLLATGGITSGGDIVFIIGIVLCGGIIITLIRAMRAGLGVDRQEARDA